MPNSPARSVIDVGTVIDDTYTIEALIGRGGMGAVFLASHLRLPGKKVAIKVLHPELGQHEVLARFRREAEIASQLGHPNIVEVHDSNTLADGTPYLVLEYLDGENLAERIARGPMTVDETFAILRQIVSALTAAHREGIVHRDLKPQNVFLVPTEVGGAVIEKAKVLDFGISKIRGSQTVKTQDSAMLGTPQYMAPEQATGKHADVDDRTDVFALGAMVYEMLCGQPAFTGASVPEVVFKVVYEEAQPLGERVPGLDPAIAAAVARAMAKKQDDRWSTVGAFLEALTGQPTSLIRPPRPKPAGTASTSSSVGSNPTNVSSDEALAQTVGSGDHGKPPMAIADTLASGDHRESRPTLGTGPGLSVATRPPVPAPAPAPEAPRRSRALPIAIGIALVAGGIVLAIALTRGGKRDQGVAATPAPDAAVVADAALIVTAPVDAASPTDATVIATLGPDAAPPRARSDARVKERPDAGTAAATNPEADDTYEKGLDALAKDPERTKEMGYRLRDRYDDPRGWVLIGASSCSLNKKPLWNEAKAKLKTNGPLLRKLFSLCRNNMPN
jgi:eukaryotic-like serine/threonine-protein kinase